jgi:hypothetical protein
VTESAPHPPEGHPIQPTATEPLGVGRRRFLKGAGLLAAMIGLGSWRIPSAIAACGYSPGQVVYTQNNHSCGDHCGSGMFPDDKWTKYYNSSSFYQSCSCMYVGCLGAYRCNGSKQWWMTQIGYTYCCDVCS